MEFNRKRFKKQEGVTMKAKIGEIWLVTIPVLEIDENNDINVKL